MGTTVTIWTMAAALLATSAVLLATSAFSGCAKRSASPPSSSAATSETATSDSARSALTAEYRELTREYNEQTGARQLAADELERWLAAGEPVILLDVREANEVAVSSLPGARHVPPNRVGKLDLTGLLSARMSPGAQMSPDAKIVAYCTAGYRSGLAAVELEKRLGRPVLNLDGGIIAWFNAGGEVRNPSGVAVDEIHPYGDEWARFVAPRRSESPKSGSREKR